MDDARQNRQDANGTRRPDYSRQRFEREMKQRKREEIPRNGRAERLNQYFNICINVIKHCIGDIDNAQIQAEFIAKLRAISGEYPGMFTAARKRFPRLFGEQGPDLDTDALGRSELVERIRKDDNPNRIKSLVRRGGTWGRDKDEIRVRQALAKIRDLCVDLLLQRENNNIQAANQRLLTLLNEEALTQDRDTLQRRLDAEQAETARLSEEITALTQGRDALQERLNGKILAELDRLNQETLPHIGERLTNLEGQGIPNLPPALDVSQQHQKVMRKLVANAEVNDALRPYRGMSNQELARERSTAEGRLADLSREESRLSTDDIEKERDRTETIIHNIEIEEKIRKAIPDPQARKNARVLRHRELLHEKVIEHIKPAIDAIMWINAQLRYALIDRTVQEQLDATCTAAKELLTKAKGLMLKPLKKKIQVESASRNFLDQISADSRGGRGSLEEDRSPLDTRSDVDPPSGDHSPLSHDPPGKPIKLERSTARDVFAQKLREKGGAVFDIDETLIDRTRGTEAYMTMPEGFIESAERLVDEGISVAIITGRPTDFVMENLQRGGATQNLIDKIDIYGEYGITHRGPDTNGKIIISDKKAEKYIRLAEKVLDTIWKRIKENPELKEVIAYIGWYKMKLGATVYGPTYVNGVRQYLEEKAHSGEIIDIEEKLISIGNKINSIVSGVLKEKPEYKAFCKNYTNTTGIEICLNKDTREGIEFSKGTAVASLVKRLRLRSVVAFGDDIPDLDMNKALLRFIAGNQRVDGYISDRENRLALLKKSISSLTAQDETFAPTEDQIQTRIQLNEEFLSLHKSTLEYQAFVGVEHPEGLLPTEDAIIKASTFMLKNPDDTVAFITEMTDKITTLSKLESAIKTVDTKLKKVINDPHLAVHTDVSNCRNTFESAMSYLQSGEVTTEGLRAKLIALEGANARVDDCIEDRIRKEVENCSKQVMDLQCFQPRSGMFRNFKIASVLDFQQLADDFYNAKYPENAYLALHRLRRDSEAINELDRVCISTYNKSLKTIVNERLGKSEDKAKREYSLQLINEGNPGAAEGIQPLLAYPSEDELDRMADRFHLALSNGQPEEAFATLDPLDRNTRVLCDLDRRYNHKYQTGLGSDIEQHIGDPEARAYALFLLGDPALEKKKVSFSQATVILEALSKLTFSNDDGVHIQLPFDLLSSQISLTHSMSEALKEGGLGSMKIFALSLRTDESGQKQANLHVKTDLAPDMLDGKDPIDRFVYSMAPLIQVEASFGTVPLVLSPSLSSGLLTVRQWMSKLGQASFEDISLDACRAKLVEEYRKNPEVPYPAGTYVFTGSRNFAILPFSPDNLDNLRGEKRIPDWDTSKYYQDCGKAELNEHAAQVPFRRTARSLREELRNPTIHDDASAERFLKTIIAPDFVKNVNTFRPGSIAEFTGVFPRLAQEFQGHLVERNVSIPTRERFERILSGDYGPSGIKVDQRAFSGHSISNVEKNNIFLQAPDPRLEDAESQFHKMMDPWLLETIPTHPVIRDQAMEEKEISEHESMRLLFKDAFDCYQDLDVMKKCFSEEEVNSFVDGLSRIRQGITDRALLGESADQGKGFRDLDTDNKQLAAIVEQFKESIIKDILEISDVTMENVDFYRITYEDEVKQIEKYFNICVGKLQDGVSEVKEYESKESNYDILSQEVNNLIDSIVEAEKAMNIIAFRERYPTARGILDAHNPPEDLLQWHADFSLRGWKEISKERAEKEFDRKITDEEFDEEFQEYHEDYLRKLDQHALNLVAPEDTEICIRRRPHKLLEILACGRIKSMFETQTAGSQQIGSKRQAEIEEACYGFPLDHPDEVRPLYTSVTKGPYSFDSVVSFGAAVIKLNPSVQQRATKIMYDSGCLVGIDSRFLTGRPVPFNEPGRNCFSLTDPRPNFTRFGEKNLTPDERTKITTTPSKKDPLEFKTANDIRPWLEGQIHGGLTIDDIERVDFSESMDFELKRELDRKINNSQKAYLRKLLNDAGDYDVEKIIENTEAEGLSTVIEGMLREPISDQIKIEFEKMYSRRLEYLKRLAEEQKEKIKKLLEERSIAYSFYGDTTDSKRIAKHLLG